MSEQTPALESGTAPASTAWAKQMQGSRAVKPSPFTRSFGRIYSSLPRAPALIQKLLASLLLCRIWPWPLLRPRLGASSPSALPKPQTGWEVTFPPRPAAPSLPQPQEAPWGGGVGIWGQNSMARGPTVNSWCPEGCHATKEHLAHWQEGKPSAPSIWVGEGWNSSAR